MYKRQGKYDDEFILKWLKNFYRRFFAQQFKRSCLPDGPKVGTVAVSYTHLDVYKRQII